MLELLKQVQILVVVGRQLDVRLQRSRMEVLAKRKWSAGDQRALGRIANRFVQLQIREEIEGLVAWENSSVPERCSETYLLDSFS